MDEQRSRYEYIAQQIEREDGLANYRLTWTLQLNGFLFAALALIGREMDPEIGRILKIMLPVAGIVVSTAGLLGTLAALLAILNLRSNWRGLKKVWRRSEDPRWPRPFGKTGAFWFGQVTNLSLPSALIVVWVVLLVWLWLG